MVNREIKFRGKRVDNGEWAYGGYIDTNSIAVPIVDNSTGFYGIDDIEVIPETVGQYTGLKDKNGKEIYEGDILKGSDFYLGDSFVKCKAGRVVFGNGCFYTLGEQSVGELTREAVKNYDVEVIGNFFENQDLLQ